MQLVIEINEETYKDMLDNFEFASMLEDFKLARRVVRSFQATIADAIQNGVPLPKEHGRLIDADAIFKTNFSKANIKGEPIDNMIAYPYWKTDITGLQNLLNSAPTILEASEE